MKVNNDKTWYDEVKEEFIKNIQETHTLNLAISILEDRKQLLDTILEMEQEINEVQNEKN